VSVAEVRDASAL